MAFTYHLFSQNDSGIYSMSEQLFGIARPHNMERRGSGKRQRKKKCENIMNKKLHVKNRRKAINKIALRIELVKFISRRQRCR